MIKYRTRFSSNARQAQYDYRKPAKRELNLRHGIPDPDFWSKPYQQYESIPCPDCGYVKCAVTGVGKCRTLQSVMQPAPAPALAPKKERHTVHQSVAIAHMNCGDHIRYENVHSESTYRRSGGHTQVLCPSAWVDVDSDSLPSHGWYSPNCETPTPTNWAQAYAQMQANPNVFFGRHVPSVGMTVTYRVYNDRLQYFSVVHDQFFDKTIDATHTQSEHWYLLRGAREESELTKHPKLGDAQVSWHDAYTHMKTDARVIYMRGGFRDGTPVMHVFRHFYRVDDGLRTLSTRGEPEWVAVLNTHGFSSFNWECVKVPYSAPSCWEAIFEGKV